MMPDLVFLSPDNIEATSATQIRTKIHSDVVNIYTKDMEDGAIFPPLDVFAEKGSERYILADGFHRHRAYINTETEEIQCHLHEGGLQEALVFALGANEQHGLRRSSADKRLAVKKALKDPAISQLTLREIADICRVSHTTVAKLRNEMQLEDQADDPDPSDHNPDGETPEDATEEDKAVQKEATQSEVETREVQQACDLIKALPYPGQDSIVKLELTDELVADLEYLSTWAAHAVIEYRGRRKEEENGS
jgi:uncharacterized ParB-like nuclease family protein